MSYNITLYCKAPRATPLPPPGASKGLSIVLLTGGHGGAGAVGNMKECWEVSSYLTPLDPTLKDSATRPGHLWRAPAQRLACSSFLASIFYPQAESRSYPKGTRLEALGSEGPEPNSGAHRRIYRRLPETVTFLG